MAGGGPPEPERALDVICLGRVAVDLYGEQFGGRLEEMKSFSMSLGGSSGNVCFGAARLGLRASMLARVGDEQMGRFLREALEAEGADVRHLSTDPARLTALVILGIRGDGTFPHIFYRTDCADMGLEASDVDADYIGSARCLAVTGTHLSHPRTAEAVKAALGYAADRNVERVLDIDYRPVLWGLVSPGEGEDRFVPSPEVTRGLQAVLGSFDVVVGTEEELCIAGGSTDTLAAIEAVRAHTDAVIVCKRGDLGCVVFEGAIPSSLDGGEVVAGFPVKVQNTLGAGDAFLSGLLCGHLEGHPWAIAARLGNYCGAHVVARTRCSSEMPSRAFLEEHVFPWLLGGDSEPVASAPMGAARTRAADARPLCVLAFDHRTQLEAMLLDAASPAGGRPARTVRDLPALKRLILDGAVAGAEALTHSAPGVICCDRYGAEVLTAAAARGWWVARPVELPGSRPLAFEHGPAVGLTLHTWPRGHIAKCLVRYAADDDVTLLAAQETTLRTLQDACERTGVPLLLEVIPPDGGSVPEAMRALYEAELRPSWWKIKAPVDEGGWVAVGEVIRRFDPAGCEGVLVLGLDAPLEALGESLRVAARARAYGPVRGFAVGRTIFGAAARRWIAGELDDAGLKREVAERFATLIEIWEGAL